MTNIPKQPIYYQQDLNNQELLIKNKYSYLSSQLTNQQLDIQIGILRETVNIMQKAFIIAQYDDPIFCKIADKAKLQQNYNLNNQECTICRRQFNKKVKPNQCSFCAKMCCNQCCYRTRQDPQDCDNRVFICDTCDEKYRNLLINKNYKQQELLINEAMQKIAKQIIVLQKKIQVEQEQLKETRAVQNDIPKQDYKKVMKISKLKGEISKSNKQVEKNTKQINLQIQKQKKLITQIAMKEIEKQQKKKKIQHQLRIKLQNDKKIQQQNLRIQKQKKLQQQQAANLKILQNSKPILNQTNKIIIQNPKSSIENPKSSTHSQKSQKSSQYSNKNKTAIQSTLQVFQTNSKQDNNRNSLNLTGSIQQKYYNSKKQNRSFQNQIVSEVQTSNKSQNQQKSKNSDTENKKSVNQEIPQNTPNKGNYPVQYQYFQQTKVDAGMQNLTTSNISIQQTPQRTTTIQKRLSKRLTQSEILAMRVPVSGMGARISHNKQQQIPKRKMSFSNENANVGVQKSLNKEQILQKSRKGDEEQANVGNIIDEKSKCACMIF